MTMLAKAQANDGMAAYRQDGGLSREQVELIKDTIAKGASDSELSLFVQTCNRLALDPFARQIFLVKRYDSMTGKNVAQAQVSIDGFRLVAERTRQYRGQTAPQWCGLDGKWTDVWLSDEPPAAARCGVHRDGFAEPLVRVARFASYAQRTKDGHLTKMWRTMPDVMLAKCAEALALRAAFPNELGGVYTAEEMDQADNGAPARSEPAKRLPRSLDDVAGEPPPHDPSTGELIQGELEPAPAPKSAVDEYGLTVPPSPCPAFSRPGPNQFKRWNEVPVPLIAKMYAEAGARMSSHQTEWCEYLMARRQARKAREEQEQEQANV